MNARYQIELKCDIAPRSTPVASSNPMRIAHTPFRLATTGSVAAQCTTATAGEPRFTISISSAEP